MLHELCDDILQLIFYELIDPAPFSLTCKRLHSFTQDPYVRANYFLNRYGRIQAMFHAFGRGKVLSERVLEIMISSGTHISRYLCQVAIHHYFYTHTHFIKTHWIRSVPLPVFTYFLKIASDLYDNIPRGKGDDDGTLFQLFIRESRFPASMKTVSQDTIRDIVDRYKFIPFSQKDPLMSQFPLALAAEPSLLPFAVKNGFSMEHTHRDFVFRKMFERVTDRKADDIVHNVKELCKLDESMFVSRTVACEVCMEAKTNEAGYAALKQLDTQGCLRFSLTSLVEDLLKLFVSRSLSSSQTQSTIKHLFADVLRHNAADPVIRLVMLLTVFLPLDQSSPPETIQAQLDQLHLGKLTKTDVGSLLQHPHMEKPVPVIEYLRSQGLADNGDHEHKKSGKKASAKGMGPKFIRPLIEEITENILERNTKGKTLKLLVAHHPYVRDTVMRIVLEKHSAICKDLPETMDKATIEKFKLSRHTSVRAKEEEYIWSGSSTTAVVEDGELVDDVDTDMNKDGGEGSQTPDLFLGHLSLDSLSLAIRQDEQAPANRGRRLRNPYSSSNTETNFSPFDAISVAKWVKSEYGLRSSMAAIFMIHAVVNDNSPVIGAYLCPDQHDSLKNHVPITLKHFEILARLGRSPHYYMFKEIQNGATFYRSEDEYISPMDEARSLVSDVSSEVTKAESSTASNTIPAEDDEEKEPEPALGNKRKRPRRSATTTTSYLVPDSDDDAIAYDEKMYYEPKKRRTSTKTERKETELEKWIKGLSELLKVEQAKYREQKKLAEKEANPGEKTRTYKSEFFKALSNNLRSLRKHHEESRNTLQELRNLEEEYQSDEDDEDYQGPSSARASKKRKT